MKDKWKYEPAVRMAMGDNPQTPVNILSINSFGWDDPWSVRFIDECGEQKVIKIPAKLIQNCKKIIEKENV
jgi:hypothetical protein